MMFGLLTTELCQTKAACSSQRLLLTVSECLKVYGDFILNAVQCTCRCTKGCSDYEVGQNSKQEKSQWQLLARTALDTVNYANELIREAERADKTKQPLFNHSWGLLEL